MNSTESILVIDDEEAIRDVIRLSLEEEGYKIVTASNGEEALKLLKEIPPPGLILLDLMMPVMNGKEFLRVLKEDSELSKNHIPVVLITAFNSPDITGVDSILYKPMNLDSLIKVAHDYCH